MGRGGVYPHRVGFMVLICMGSHSGMTFTKTKLHGVDRTAMYQLKKDELVLREKDLYVPDLLPDGKDVPK